MGTFALELTDFTSLFSPYDFKKNVDISKMNECNSVGIKETNLSEQTKFLTGIENYFHQEINQIKLRIKKLGKYVTVFDYINKILIVLSAATGGVSIILFTSILGEPVGIASASFTLMFSLTTGIIKNLLSITKNKKKKHDKILMLAKSKLDSIETSSISSTDWHGNKSWRI